MSGRGSGRRRRARWGIAALAVVVATIGTMWSGDEEPEAKPNPRIPTKAHRVVYEVTGKGKSPRSDT